MHRANRAAWDEAAERYEGWFAEAVDDDLGRRLEPVPGRAGAHRRSPWSMPTGDPPPVRRWPRHALAVDRGRRRGRRRRLQPTHARAGRPAVRCGRCAGHLDRGRRPRHAARARRHGRPAVHRAGLAHLAPGPRRVGGGPAPTPGARRPARPVRGTSGRVAVRRRRHGATGSRPTTTTSPASRPRRAGRRSTSTTCRSPTTTSPGSSPGPGPSARSSRPSLAAGCGWRRSPSTRSTGGVATEMSLPTSAAGSRCRSRSSRGADRWTHERARSHVASGRVGHAGRWTTACR